MLTSSSYTSFYLSLPWSSMGLLDHSLISNPATGIWSNIQYSCGATLFSHTLNRDPCNLVISGNGFIFEILETNIPLSHHSFLYLYFLFLPSIGPALQLGDHPSIDSSIPSHSPFCLSQISSVSTFFPNPYPGIFKTLFTSLVAPTSPSPN